MSRLCPAPRERSVLDGLLVRERSGAARSLLRGHFRVRVAWDRLAQLLARSSTIDEVPLACLVDG